MLKNKLKVIAILSIMILTLTLPVVRAENEDNEANKPGAITSENISNGTNNEVLTSNNENLKKGDVYLSGNDITIDYIIDGNLFVFANHVTINSQIGGDAFICANSVTIGEQGYVFSNLFTFAKDVTIDGVVYDLYSASQNTTINGYVYRDIRVGSNTVNVLGTIGRNAYIDCVNLNFTQNTTDQNNTANSGTINGNLSYASKQEIAIPESAVIGEVTFEQEMSFDRNTIQMQILSLGTFVVTVVIIWLACLWLAPKFLKNSTSPLTTKKILPVIGFGILTPMVVVFASIILLILGLTSKIALLLITTLVILMGISTSIFVIMVNTIICHQLKIQKTVGIFGMLVVSSIVLWLVILIPFIGSLIKLIAVILGLGSIVSSLVLKEKLNNRIQESK